MTILSFKCRKHIRPRELNSYKNTQSWDNIKTNNNVYITNNTNHTYS